MIYYLLLDRKERYPSYEDEDLPPRNDVGQSLGGRRDPQERRRWFRQPQFLTGSLVPYGGTHYLWQSI